MRLHPWGALPYHQLYMEERDTRGERRENRRRAKRRMRVTGNSVRLLLDVARRRAERIKRQRQA
jgi:hypothetical protein